MSFRVVLIGDWFRKPVLSLVGLRRSYTSSTSTIHEQRHEWISHSCRGTFLFSLFLPLSLSFLVWRYAHNTVRYTRRKFVFGRAFGYFWRCREIYMYVYIFEMESKFNIFTRRRNRSFKNSREYFNKKVLLTNKNRWWFFFYAKYFS